jgi:hypothetical protein
MAEIVLPAKPGGFEAGYSNGSFELATVNYVLSINRQIPPVLTTTTSNLTAIYANGTSGVGATLTNSGTKSALVIDGVTLVLNDRVLIKDQTIALQNGIYKVTNIGSISTNWILTRVDEYDATGRIRKGDIIPVVKGDVNKVSLWMLTSEITAIGTSDFIFGNVNSNSLVAITGTTNQINVDVVNGVANVKLADNLIMPGTGAITIPVGNTAQRPSNPTIGMIRYNTDL